MKRTITLPARGFLSEAPTGADMQKYNRLVPYEQFLDLTHSVEVAKMIAARCEKLVLDSGDLIYTNKDAHGFYNGDSLQRAMHDWEAVVILPRYMREREKDAQDR